MHAMMVCAVCARQVRLVKPVSGGFGLKADGRNTIIGVTAGGVADKAGLRVGDVVFKVDGESLAQGKGALGTALSGSAHVLQVAYMKGEEGQAVEVKDFVQPSSGGLGIKVDPSNVISQISKGGAAHKDGRLRIGDKILFVNTQSLKAMKLADALKALGSTPKAGAPLRFLVQPTLVAPQSSSGGGGPRGGGPRGGGPRGGGRAGGGGMGGMPGMGGMGGFPGMGMGGGGGQQIDPEMLQRMMGGMGGMGGGGMPGMPGMGGFPGMGGMGSGRGGGGGGERRSRRG